jgi:hypothetical protein
MAHIMTASQQLLFTGKIARPHVLHVLLEY